MALIERYVSALAGGGGDGTVGSPWTLVEAAAAAVAGDRVNIKADGTYTLSADFIPTNSGSTAACIFWRGYKTIITDGYQGYNTDGTLITTNFPTIACGSSYQINTGGKYGNQFVCLNITSAKTWDYLLYDGAGGCLVIFCKLTHSGAGGYAVGFEGGGDRIVFSEVNSTLYGVAMGYAGNACIGCRVKTTAAGGVGISLGQASYIQAVGNVVFDCGEDGIKLNNFSTNALVMNNTISNCVGAGISRYAGIAGLLEANNIITGCGVGRALGSAVQWTSVFDRTRDNGADTDTGDWPIYREVTTDTGGDETDYVDAGSEDFRLIVASPATRSGAFGLNDIGALIDVGNPAITQAATPTEFSLPSSSDGLTWTLVFTSGETNPVGNVYLAADNSLVVSGLNGEKIRGLVNNTSYKLKVAVSGKTESEYAVAAATSATLVANYSAGAANILVGQADQVDGAVTSGTFDEAARNIGTTAESILTGSSITIQGAVTSGTFDEAARNIGTIATNILVGASIRIQDVVTDGTATTSVASPAPTSLSVFPISADNIWQISISGVALVTTNYIYEHGTDVLLYTVGSSSSQVPASADLGNRYIYCRSKVGTSAVSTRFPLTSGLLVGPIVAVDPGYRDGGFRSDLKPAGSDTASLLGFNDPKLNTLRHGDQTVITGNMTGQPL